MGEHALTGRGNGCSAAGGIGVTDGGTAETGTPYTYFSIGLCLLCLQGCQVGVLR